MGYDGRVKCELTKVVGMQFCRLDDNACIDHEEEYITIESRMGDILIYCAAIETTTEYIDGSEEIARRLNPIRRNTLLYVPLDGLSM